MVEVGVGKKKDIYGKRGLFLKGGPPGFFVWWRSDLATSATAAATPNVGGASDLPETGM